MKDGFISIVQCIQPYVYNRNIHFWMYNKTKNKRFLKIYIYIYILYIYIDCWKSHAMDKQLITALT